MRTRSETAAVRLTESAPPSEDEGTSAPTTDSARVSVPLSVSEISMKLPGTSGRKVDVVDEGELREANSPEPGGEFSGRAAEEGTEGSESEEGEEEEDVLLDLVAAAFERRLGSMEKGPQPSGGAGEAPAGGGGEEGFLVLEEEEEAGGGSPPPPDPFAPETLAWVPQTGLPLGEEPVAVGNHPLRRRNGDTAIGPIRDPRAEARQKKAMMPKHAGPKWFDLPATQITPELKQELRLLKLRGALDPKRHYKAPDSTKFPKHFQMGTVVESAADFYGGRLTNRERKQTFGEELLADPTLKQYRKRKYTEIQAEKDLKSRRHFNKKQSRKMPQWAKGRK